MKPSGIIAVGGLLLASMVLVPAPSGWAGSRTLVVDDDGAQCPDAGYQSITDAVAGARAGSTIRVCGGTYPAPVALVKSLTLTAQTPAAPAVDCLDPADPAQTALPAAIAHLTGGITVAADNVEIDGLAISTAPIGIATTEDNSGYRIRRNLIQDTGRFGVELQSSGARRTVVERNCLRRNGTDIGDRAAIASESGALRNAVIRDNVTADNFEALSVAGPHVHRNISISHNTLRREKVGIFVSGIAVGDITDNSIGIGGTDGSAAGIIIGGGQIGLRVDSNSITGGNPGILADRAANDPNLELSVGVVVSRNVIRGSLGSGINVVPPHVLGHLDLPNLTGALFYRNDISGGAFSGIVVTPPNDNNVLIANSVTTSKTNGIALFAVQEMAASGTLLVGNTLLGNLAVDARDDAPAGQNTWIATRCVTQLAQTTICGSALAARSVTRTPSVASAVPRRPSVDQSRWPCLRVPVFEMDPDGTGAWPFVTVVAPDAPPGTYCGA